MCESNLGGGVIIVESRLKYGCEIEWWDGHYCWDAVVEVYLLLSCCFCVGKWRAALAWEGQEEQ